MAEMVVTFLVKVEEYPFEESSGEFTWDKQQIEQPSDIRSRLPKKTVHFFLTSWCERNWNDKYIYVSLRQETHWRHIVEGQYQRFVPFQVIKWHIGSINIPKQAIRGPLAGRTLRKRTGRKIGLHETLGSRDPVWEQMILSDCSSVTDIDGMWNCCKHAS